MKCYVCGYTIEEGAAACGHCGFPSIVQIGETADAGSRLAAMAEQYRREMGGQYEVGVFVYSHELKDGALRLAKTDMIRLADCGSITAGVISWFPENFVRPHTASMELTYYVQKSGGPKVSKTISLALPPGDGDIRISILKKYEGVVTLCVGTEDIYTESEKIDVFR